MAVEVWANAATGVVTAGGTNAPAPGTPQTWTVNVSAAFAVASTVASPQTHFFAADPAAPGEVFDVTVAPGGTGSQTWTVTRGADGTTPTTHALNFQVIQATAHATLQVLQRPWLVKPSGDATGATDPVAVNGAFAGTGSVELVPNATYYGNATVTGHEGQYLNATGATWNLTTTGIAAFNWTPANSSVYAPFPGGGGITGWPVINGPGGAANPADGSIAVQMGDIRGLVSQTSPHKTQWGLLLNNQFFQAEQGIHQVFPVACTNSVVAQCAGSGGALRNGSFDRTQITVYHNDTLNGSYGLGGVQLLAGAQFDGGSIRQYGNFAGTGQAGVYALYVSGVAPAGSTGHSSLIGCEIVHAMEYDGTGTAIGTILTAASCYIQNCHGNLRYVPGFGPSSLAGSEFDFTGPILGDVTLQAANAGAGIFTAVATTHATWSGNAYFAPANRATLMFVETSLTLPNAATVTNGTTIIPTIPAPFKPSTNKLLELIVFDNTANSATLLPCILTTSGNILAANSATITLGATGGTLQGQATYSTGP